jgi:DNA-directed RNA polymerase specialized sigma24 family protein
MAYSQLVDRLRSVLPEHELSLLLDIADGHSYSEMARARDKTVSSVKAKVFRVREKVRSRRISAELCAWPRG